MKSEYDKRGKIGDKIHLGHVLFWELTPKIRNEYSAYYKGKLSKFFFLTVTYLVRFQCGKLCWHDKYPGERVLKNVVGYRNYAVPDAGFQLLKIVVSTLWTS
jgi:hypothetical protein